MNIYDCYGDGDKEAVQSRYQKLYDKVKALTDKSPDAYFSSSGRAEIVGNHTDHNMGKVIVSAITCDIACAVKKRDDKLVEIYSDGFMPIRFNLNDTKYHAEEKGRSYSLARGVMAAIKKRGYTFGGFTACTQSTIFRGAGVSSSAAFEVLLAEIVNSLYLDDALTPFDKAVIGQYAENEYFGKPCGLLDQTGIALGGMNKIDFKNPASPVSERLQAPDGYDIIIVNAGGNHSSLTDHYADIRREMAAVAGFFKKKVLREVEYSDFLEAIPQMKGKISERAMLRAFHYFEENIRVDRAAQALQTNDVNAFLTCITESGESSLNCLQNAFVPGSDSQAIPLALKVAKNALHDGAVRLHGGGFAGTIIAYVNQNEADKFRREMARVFSMENVFSTKTRNIGTSRIDLSL